MISLFWGLFLAILLQCILFIPAYYFRTDKLTDFAYGLTFIFIGLFYLFFNETSFLKFVMTFIIITWALRLSIYLIIRIKKIGRDTRFDEIRKNPIKFGKFWLFQGILAWIIMLPAVLFLQSEFIDFNFLVILGLFIWLVGMLIESIADYQKFKFKNHDKNKGKWIDSGLWKYSRHPNYFGEMLIWVGVYIFAFSSISNWLIALISPISIILILRYVSGIPPLEKRYAERYKNNKDYWKYVKTTNLLIPWLKKY